MNETDKKLGTFPLVMASMSFIPMIGVLFGSIALIWGACSSNKEAKKLVVLGACGIGFNAILIGMLVYYLFIQKGALLTPVVSERETVQLTSLVKSVEFYRVQHGHYPESLQKLNDDSSPTSVVASTSLFVITHDFARIHYELKDSDQTHYYLLNVGKDGKPFTGDDVVPSLQLAPGSQVGLLIHESSLSDS